MEHAGDRLVEQVEVVTDHKQGTLVVAQEVQQPRLRVDVEVVGRFVEQQHVAPREQDARQFHAAALTAGQHLQLQVQTVRLQTETGSNGSRLAVG